MSKRETPLTRRYWQEIGGTLIEEFPAVRCTSWERVGPVPKRSHGWVVPDTVSPRTTLVSPLPGRRGMDLAISGAEVFRAVVLYCLANRRLDNE